MRRLLLDISRSTICAVLAALTVGVSAPFLMAQAQCAGCYTISPPDSPISLCNRTYVSAFNCNQCPGEFGDPTCGKEAVSEMVQECAGLLTRGPGYKECKDHTEDTLCYTTYDCIKNMLTTCPYDLNKLKCDEDFEGDSEEFETTPDYPDPDSDPCFVL